MTHKMKKLSAKSEKAFRYNQAAIQTLLADRNITSEELDSLLTARQRQVLDIMQGSPMSQREIAEKMGISMTRVRQLIEKCQEKVERNIGRKGSPVTKQLPETEIDHLNLSTHSKNLLKNIGITTISELMQLSPQELLALPNCGKKSTKEIQMALAEDQKGRT